MTLDLAQFHDTFFEESFEALDSMEAALLKLSAGESDLELINTIFRVAHSIKGGSATFGFNAIASFINTDPAKARELVLEFADFTRYSFRRHGDFTTVAEELRSIDSYLKLERARFGDRLRVTLQIAPEVLSTVVPFLSIQPLVENAVRHGLEGKEGGGRITIEASDQGAFAEISVEDDGVGIDPAVLERALAGGAPGEHVGLRNVDARLRQVYGDEHGLVVETNVGAGTLVRMRVPNSTTGTRTS